MISTNRAFGLIFIPKVSSSKNLNNPALVAGAGAILLLRLSLLLLNSFTRFLEFAQLHNSDSHYLFFILKFWFTLSKFPI